MYILNKTTNRWASCIHKNTRTHTHFVTVFITHWHFVTVYSLTTAPWSRSTSYRFQSVEISTLIVKPKQMWESTVRRAMWWKGRADRLSGQLTPQVVVKIFFSTVSSWIHTITHTKLSISCLLFFILTLCWLLLMIKKAVRCIDIN